MFVGTISSITKLYSFADIYLWSSSDVFLAPHTMMKVGAKEGFLLVLRFLIRLQYQHKFYNKNNFLQEWKVVLFSLGKN